MGLLSDVFLEVDEEAHLLARFIYKARHVQRDHEEYDEDEEYDEEEEEPEDDEYEEDEEAEHMDTFWGKPIPNPIPNTGAKVTATGTFSTTFTGSSSGTEADPIMGILTLQKIEYHGSAHLLALTQADGFLIVPQGIKEVPAGQPLAFLPTVGALR